MKKKIWSLISAIFGVISVIVGSTFGIVWFFVGWVVLFGVMALADWYFCKKNEKKFYLANTPWAALGGVIATMIHAIMVGINEG